MKVDLLEIYLLAQALNVTGAYLLGWDDEAGESDFSDLVENTPLSDHALDGNISVLYKRLSSLCKERGITAYRMCKDTGIQPSIMTDLKMGRRQTVKAETAAKIAAYFGVSVDYLLGNDKKNKPTTTGELTLDEMEYLRLYRGATEDARRLAELALKSDKPD